MLFLLNIKFCNKVLKILVMFFKILFDDLFSYLVLMF